MSKHRLQSLFRSEVFESQLNSGFGAIRLQRPLGGWFASVVCLVGVLSLAVILAIGKVGNFRHAHGVLVDGVGNFFVPENELREIRIGQSVTLRCLSHTQRHDLPKGQVMEIGHTPFLIKELSAEYFKHVSPAIRESSGSIAFYKVKVQLEKKKLHGIREHTMRSGLDIEANISVGDRRMWAYLFKNNNY